MRVGSVRDGRDPQRTDGEAAGRKDTAGLRNVPARVCGVRIYLLPMIRHFYKLYWGGKLRLVFVVTVMAVTMVMVIVMGPCSGRRVMPE